MSFIEVMVRTFGNLLFYIIFECSDRFILEGLLKISVFSTLRTTKFISCHLKSVSWQIRTAMSNTPSIKNLGKAAFMFTLHLFRAQEYRQAFTSLQI